MFKTSPNYWGYNLQHIYLFWWCSNSPKIKRDIYQDLLGDHLIKVEFPLPGLSQAQQSHVEISSRSCEISADALAGCGVTDNGVPPCWPDGRKALWSRQSSGYETWACDFLSHPMFQCLNMHIPGWFMRFIWDFLRIDGIYKIFGDIRIV